MSRPCDTEDDFTPLTPEQNNASILNFDAWRLRRVLQDQLSHDLAMAFRSADAGKYDGEPK